MNSFDWDLLLRLTRDIPNNLDKKKDKGEITDDVKVLVKARDGSCRLCGKDNQLVVHHVIPNGPAIPENLILLCRRCHTVVHLLLAITGKWKQVSLYQMMGRR